MNAKGGFFTLYGVFLCVLHTSLFWESGAVPTLNVEELCRRKNYVILEGYDSAILQVTTNVVLDCEILWKTTRSSKVVVSFEEYSINRNDTLIFNDSKDNQVSLKVHKDGNSFIFSGPVTMHYFGNMNWSSFSILFTTTEKASFRVCRKGLFLCKNSICIKNSSVCDGRNNCGDMSDETECRGCSPYEFRCSNKRCIPKYKICDRMDDCGDESDERDCPFKCSSNEFKCVSNKCIGQYKVCDGHNDCGDSSDETNCYQKCDFRCRNNKCIEEHQRCNGKDDCGDNSDERVCGNLRRDPQEKDVSGNLKVTGILSMIAIGMVVIFTIVFGVCFCVLMKKKADKQPTHNASFELQQTAPSSVMGRLRHSFRSLGRPTAPPLQTVSATESAPPEYQQTSSVVGRTRNSFHSNRQPTAHPPKSNTTSDLRSGNSGIYPRLAPAGDSSGVDNPEFKVEE